MGDGPVYFGVTPQGEDVSLRLACALSQVVKIGRSPMGWLIGYGKSMVDLIGHVREKLLQGYVPPEGEENPGRVERVKQPS